MEKMTTEWQFDGLVGPTHNYAGLATGNLAAAHNAGAVSNPKLAALQGLNKMRFVRDLGMPQAFLPPHYRPLLVPLKRLGFSGNIEKILEDTANQAPGLLASVYSSSFMWAANAATVSPSTNSFDGKLHLTPANLVSHFHRSLEAEFNYRVFDKIFHNKSLFSVHYPLYPTDILGDEGAANHMLFNDNNNNNLVHFFVYGENNKKTLDKIKFVPRQKQLASISIARLHGIEPLSVYLQQSPHVINQGVFHNDVIAMNTDHLMIVHEESFIDAHQHSLRELAARQPGFRYREVTAQELSVAEAVATYLFNSQLLMMPDRKFTLVAPAECLEHPGAASLVEKFLAEGILSNVHYLNVRESMRNGGGPACLRLRVAMTPQEAAAMHPGVILTDAMYDKLVAWVELHYRDRLSFSDLRDPQLITELQAAYADLEAIIGMPGLYKEYY